MTPEVSDAFAALAPLLSSTVLVALVTGFWGYKSKAREGRVDTTNVTEWIKSGPPMGARDIEILATAASSVASVINRNNILQEFRLGLDKLEQSDRFEAFVRKRENAINLENFIEQQRLEQMERTGRRPIG